MTLASSPAFTIAVGDLVALVADVANATPITLVVSSILPAGTYQSQPISMRQYSCFTATFIAVDGNGDDIDVDGHACKMVVTKLDSALTEVFEVSGLTGDGNQIPFTVASAKSQVAGSWTYEFWDVQNASEPVALGGSSFEIVKRGTPA